MLKTCYHFYLCCKLRKVVLCLARSVFGSNVSGLNLCGSKEVIYWDCIAKLFVYGTYILRRLSSFPHNTQYRLIQAFPSRLYVLLKLYEVGSVSIDLSTLLSARTTMVTNYFLACSVKRILSNFLPSYARKEKYIDRIAYPTSLCPIQKEIER